MKKQFISAGFIFFSFMLPLKVNAAQFGGMFVFGDSLSDAGNTYYATANQYPQSPPYGDPPILPNGQKYPGRFSNGRVWVEYLAERLNISQPTLVTDLVPDLDFNKFPTTTLPAQGVNFAFGGASSGFGNAVLPQLPIPGVLAQVQGFAANLQAKNQQADSNALYTLWASANDFIFINPVDSITPSNNVALALNTLAGVGAKNILVLNLPDLTQLPLYKGNNPKPPQDAVDDYNSRLKQTLDGLSNNPNLNIMSVDIDYLFKQVSASPNSFGFTNVSDFCLNEATLEVCSNPEQYLFWDRVHPSTVTHQLIADKALAAINAKSVPEPSTALGTLLIGAWGAVVVLNRKRKQPLVTIAGRVPGGLSTHIKVES